MPLTRHTRTRWFVAPFVVAFLAFSYVSYDAPPTPRINVRWSEDVTQSDRETRAVAYGLARPEFEEERTWSYAILETSTDNVRRLVQDPAVEDTYGIDRTTFELVAPLTAPMNVLFRWLGVSSLIGVVAGLLVTWIGPTHAGDPPHRWSRGLARPTAVDRASLVPGRHRRG